MKNSFMCLVSGKLALSKSYVTQVARGFSCAVSGFGRVIIVVSIFGRRSTAETEASCQVRVKNLWYPG